MDESCSRPRERRLISVPTGHSESRIQYVLNAEAKILQSIAARAPVPAILNEVCSALDCQMGNMVSLISLPEDDATSIAERAHSAALFGLYIFFSVDIFARNGEELGSLEMYCCTRRNPSSNEVHLIERATCLAAIAIERDAKAAPWADDGIRARTPSRRIVPGWPASMN